MTGGRIPRAFPPSRGWVSVLVMNLGMFLLALRASHGGVAASRRGRRFGRQHRPHRRAREACRARAVRPVLHGRFGLVLAGRSQVDDPRFLRDVDRAVHRDVLRRPAHAPYRSGLYLDDDLRPALSAGPPVRFARRYQRRPGRVEPDHLGQQAGSGQLRSRRASGKDRALPPRPRVRPCRARALELVGRRRVRPRQGKRPLFRREQAQRDGASGASISGCAGRSTCRPRRRASR